jgi:hypothetical protein
MKMAWPIAKATTNHQDCPVEEAKAIPIKALISITMHTHFCLPTRKAISFPNIDEGTPKKLITPAMVVAAKKKLSPEAVVQNAKNATIQLLVANSSNECAV